MSQGKDDKALHDVAPGVEEDLGGHGKEEHADEDLRPDQRPDRTVTKK